MEKRLDVEKTQFNFATTWTFGVLPEKCTEDLNSNLRP